MLTVRLPDFNSINSPSCHEPTELNASDIADGAPRPVRRRLFKKRVSSERERQDRQM